MYVILIRYAKICASGDICKLNCNKTAILDKTNSAKTPFCRISFAHATNLGTYI